MNIDVHELIEQKPGEKIIILARSHWLTFAVELVQLVVLAAVPVFLQILFTGVWPDLLVHPVARPLLILATSAFYLMLWLFFIVKFVDYYLDVYLLTTDRILDISQKGMFHRTVSELDLSNVQDVTSDVKGVIRSILNFGDVHIQTAAEEKRFIFEDVPRPDAIRRRMLELVEDDRRRQGETIKP